MNYIFTALFILAFIGNSLSKKECIKGPSHLYAGTRSVTATGRTCQRWDVNYPHEVKQSPQDGGHHNYCRNPDKDSRGTWCYTTDPDTKWEYCNIPKCSKFPVKNSAFYKSITLLHFVAEDAAKVVWTSYDDRDNSAFFQFATADPELVKKRRPGAEAELYRKVFANSQLKAPTVGKNGKKIFFNDVVNNFLGIFNTKTLEVQHFLEGDAIGIYATAQDYVTGNVYWTDTHTKTVMVADDKFRAKVSIYSSSPSEPRAIAVLQKERKLVFSTYVKLNTKVRGAEILITDLSGGNVKVLYKSPSIVDVTGLAVDGERIYWTDNLGYASKVMSCRIDGSDLTEHYFKRQASFEDIAVYSEYIYVTDSRQRYNYFDHVRYHIEVIGKDSDQVFTYSKPDQPHGIAILREAEDYELPSEIGSSLRQCQKRCGGVCLPDSDGVFSCRCTYGHLLRKITGSCVPVQGKFDDKLAIRKKKSQG